VARGDMDVLWAPWRMAYIGGPRDSRCLFCVQLATDDPRAGLVLARPRNGIIMLNRFPYANAHLMVAPQRHTPDLNELLADEYADLSEYVRFSAAVLQQEFRPEGLNIGINLGRAAGAGIADHLHWHLVPRWVGDINFMPIIGQTHVMPEHLETLHDRLRPRFAALETNG
jgi:ATP adenylyltransferase